MPSCRQAVRSINNLDENPCAHLRGGTRLLKPEQGSVYSDKQAEKLKQIHARLIEARRELDALIGDAYLRPRASIVPVHFLDLASAVEKLRWAEKEWRELDKEIETLEGSKGVAHGAEAVPAEVVGAKVPRT